MCIGQTLCLFKVSVFTEFPWMKNVIRVPDWVQNIAWFSWLRNSDAVETLGFTPDGVWGAGGILPVV